MTKPIPLCVCFAILRNTAEGTGCLSTSVQTCELLESKIWTHCWVSVCWFPFCNPPYFRKFLKIYFIDFSQRGRKRDRELETLMREKHRSAASCTPPTGDVPTTNEYAFDWKELNPGPFSMQSDALSTEPNQLRL